MLIDAHLRCSGRERADDVLRTLDEAQVERAVLVAPQHGEATSLRHGNTHLATLLRSHGDRLIGLAAIDPLSAEAPDELRQAVDQGLSGATLVASGWYPFEPAVQPAFAEAARLRLPLLLRCGLDPDARTSRFGRPLDFEPLRAHRGLQVVLTQLGWPWTDEAVALGLGPQRTGHEPFRFDLAPLPPPPYRREWLGRALATLGPGALQFGSHCELPCSGRQIAERRGELQDLLDQFDLDAAARERIWSGSASAWLGERGRAEGARFGLVRRADPRAAAMPAARERPLPDEGPFQQPRRTR